MTDTRIHPVTGQTLLRQVRRQDVVFGSLSCSVEVPGWYPEGEGDSLHTGRDLVAKEAAFQDLRNAYGKRVRDIRKRFKLTQEEAGHLLGGGPRAFQKYEAGTMAPSDAAVGLLEVLTQHPEGIDVLKKLRRPHPSHGKKAEGGRKPSRSAAT